LRVLIDMIDQNSIWGQKQNHPYLVVEDCRNEFNLTEEQCERLRFFLMNRGINKWLLVRRRFIRLKHEVKDMLLESEPRTERYKLLQYINEKMQNIAKMPRWVEWNTYIHKKRAKDEEEIIIKGRHC